MHVPTRGHPFWVSSYHEEGVANPETPPAFGTLWDGNVLAVDSHSLGWCFTHRAATDVLGDLVAADGHHGYRSGGGKPIGFIIAAGVVAHFVYVAINKRHGAEASQAGASKTFENGGTKHGMEH